MSCFNQATATRSWTIKVNQVSHYLLQKMHKNKQTIVYKYMRYLLRVSTYIDHLKEAD